MAVDRAAFRSPWTVGQFLEELRSPEGGLDVLRVNDRVVAYCCTRRLYDEMHILRLASLPEERRRGHARELLRRAVATAQEVGCAQVILEVGAANQSALALYRQMGFIELGRRRCYYEDGQDAVLMSHALLESAIA